MTAPAIMKVPPMEPMTIAIAMPQVRPKSLKLNSGFGTNKTTFEIDVASQFSTARTQ